MPKKLTEWNKFVRAHAGCGKSLKSISKEYKMCQKHKSSTRGAGLSGGKKVVKSRAPKGALAALLQGLNANIAVK